MRARAALPRRRAARRPRERLVPAGCAAAGRRRGGVDRALPAHDLRRLPRAGDALSAGALRARRVRARRVRARVAAAGGDVRAAGTGAGARVSDAGGRRVGRAGHDRNAWAGAGADAEARDRSDGRWPAAIRLAAGRAGRRLRRRAGAGPVRGASLVLLLRRPHRLGLPHARRRLPDPPRPGLLAPRPAQLPRAVPERLLQHLLPLGGRHPVRRQRAARARAPDLGLPAVQRVHARSGHRPGLGARAPARARRLARRPGDVDDRAAGARLRLRARRLRQGDLLALADPRARRARRAPPALAARAAPRGRAVRARRRRRGLGARGRVRRVGARGGGRARRGRRPGDCLGGHRSG